MIYWRIIECYLTEIKKISIIQPSKKKKYESEKQSDSRKFSKKNHKYSNLWRGGIEEEILDGTCRDVCTGCGRS